MAPIEFSQHSQGPCVSLVLREVIQESEFLRFAIARVKIMPISPRKVSNTYARIPKIGFECQFDPVRRKEAPRGRIDVAPIELESFLNSSLLDGGGLPAPKATAPLPPISTTRGR